MAAANKNLIRAINRFNILHAIRTHERISRVDIAKVTGLSQASVTGITADLFQEGLLQEKESGESIGGRRPVMIALNPNGAYAVGVYLSIYQINVVIVNFQADILTNYSLPLKKFKYAPNTIANKIVQAIQACMWEANFSREQISGIGICIPGPVDSQTGTVRYLPNYRWEHVNLRDMVQEKINHPTYIENSANALTIAEQWFGAGKGLNHFLVVTLEYGVGLGAVVNGQLYRGHEGTAGEFGHITIDPDGPLCRCGGKGCLEAIVGNNAILREARHLVTKGRWSPSDKDNIRIDDVILAAKNGSKSLQKIYSRAGRVLGIGLSNLIELYNPSKVIVSGKGVEAGYLLFESMYDAIHQFTHKKINGNAEVIVKDWNQKAYARGAGALVIQEIYQSPANRVVPII